MLNDSLMAVPPATAPDTPLLIFLNPQSGGGLAGDVLDIVRNDPTIRCVVLPDDAATWAERHREFIQQPNLRIVGCGGDGTVNWITSLLAREFGFQQATHRPPIAFLPFGTGNDMSRALGWGKKVTSSYLGRLAKKLAVVRGTQVIRDVDVWNIKVVRTDTQETLEMPMTNYFSIGVDAEITKDFEDCRQSKCNSCFCCPCMNMACYVPVALQNLCCKRPLRNYCNIQVAELSDDGSPTTQTLPMPLKGGDKTITFLNLPRMYAGLDPWRVDTPRGVDDGKFEIVVQGGTFLIGMFMIGCPCPAARWQGSGAQITVAEPCYFQVDGEAKFMNGPATFTLTRAGSYPMLFKR